MVSQLIPQNMSSINSTYSAAQVSALQQKTSHTLRNGMVVLLSLVILLLVIGGVMRTIGTSSDLENSANLDISDANGVPSQTTDFVQSDIGVGLPELGTVEESEIALNVTSNLSAVSENFMNSEYAQDCSELNADIETCLLLEAQNKDTVRPCLYLLDSNTRDFCILQYARFGVDRVSCGLIQSESLQNICLE